MKFVTAWLIAMLALVACSTAEDSSAKESAVRKFLTEIEASVESKDPDRVLSHVHRPWGGFEDNEVRFRAAMARYFARTPNIDLVVGVDRIWKPGDGTLTAELTVRGFQTSSISLQEPFKAWIHVYKKEDGKWEVVTASWMLERDHKR